eukprot:CAMPEP_0198679826 /NCGR_PEP_ID=MMETSP1468-20131203/3412_1 /TAXON_ID=1461545 /ORGANISM="Mantoniella sp, Strain CCMP1436" /LENGTH=115 /DNA_ID=CAMNT_0044419013 /DNA_START=145 /DNA_END=492 /DNA_ORIENTATION=-
MNMMLKAVAMVLTRTTSTLIDKLDEVKASYAAVTDTVAGGSRGGGDGRSVGGGGDSGGKGDDGGDGGGRGAGGGGEGGGGGGGNDANIYADPLEEPLSLSKEAPTTTVSPLSATL